MVKPRATSVAAIPSYMAGPLPLVGAHIADVSRREDILVPLATLETPLIPAVNRGAKAALQAQGIHVTVVGDIMTRSVLLEAQNARQTADAWQQISAREQEIAHVVESTTRFGRFTALHGQLVGNLLFLRLGMTTGDAAGHNMVTLAAEALTEWVLQQFSDLKWVSISGNLCADKKVSAVNGLLGRGKHVIAEARISQKICETLLRTSPARMVALNVKKNLIGSILAGSVRSANAHFANILLAFYLATGQDAANIIEGSQGITHTEVRQGDLAISITMPNLIVGTVGNGKQLEFARENLTMLGCTGNAPPGANARRLAAICGAAVLCGELSLLAAQTNRGELMRAHRLLER